jgi:DUF917 family protein
VWIVDNVALDAIAIGAGVQDTGGGGTRTWARPTRGHWSPRASDPPDDALVVSVGGMRGPTVGVERV